MIRGVLLQVAYDGTGYCGWARQREGNSLEEVVQGALLAMDSKASRLRGSSRTDAGVHAECQMVAFDSEMEIAPRGWVLGINQHLPDSVAVRSARIVQAEFAPRFHARWKRYGYSIYHHRLRHPHFERDHWHVRFTLDRSRMVDAARRLVGRHDFAAFRSTSDERTETTRDIRDVRVEADGAAIKVIVEGDGFLHNMVRIIVGTLVDVGRGRLAPDVVDRALQAKDRKLLGMTAPARGLCLEWTELEGLDGNLEQWP